MKKILFFAALLISGLMFTACSSSDDNPVTPPTPTPTPTPTGKADVVMMYYAVGGSDLDDDTEEALATVAYDQSTKFANARTFIQYKYSAKPNPKWDKGYVMSGDPGCAYRFEASKENLNPNFAINEKGESNIEKVGKVFNLNDKMKVGDKTYKMYDPNNLKDFINYCMQQEPNAKVYVLAFGDHGGAYSVTSDYNKSLAQSRGVMYDDNFEGNPCMSPTEIATAVKAVGKKIDLVFFDCCLMSNLEVLSELHSSNLIDYVFASGHTVTQCPMSLFVEDVVKGLNKGSWLDGAKQYVRDITNLKEGFYKKSPSTAGRNMDYTLTDMSKLPAALASIKAVAEYLVALPDATLSTKMDDFTLAASSCYQYTNTSPFYDVMSYFNMLKEKVFTNDQKFAQLVENAKTAIYACHVAHQEYNYVSDTEKDKPHWNLSYSITLGFNSSRLDFSKVKEADKRTVPNQGVIMVAIKAGHGKPADPYYNDFMLENGENYYASWEEGQEVNVRFVNNYYAKGSHSYESWDNTYRTTAFDGATKWSAWMKKNTGIPYDNPPLGDEGNVVFDDNLDDFLNDLNNWLDEVNGALQ